MSERRLLLVRHCQASGQLSEDPLTEVGFEQADALSEFLADRQVDFVVSSAFKRAWQTIAPFAVSAGLTARVDPRLNERTLSDAPVENWREVIRDSFVDPDMSLPGGESGREVLQRGWACLNELLDGGHNLPLAVSHGNLLSLVLNSVDPAFGGYAGWESLSNPDVYLLHNAGDGRLAFQRLWGVRENDQPAHGELVETIYSINTKSSGSLGPSIWRRLAEVVAFPESCSWLIHVLYAG